MKLVLNHLIFLALESVATAKTIRQTKAKEKPPKEAQPPPPPPYVTSGLDVFDSHLCHPTCLVRGQTLLHGECMCLAEPPLYEFGISPTTSKLTLAQTNASHLDDDHILWESNVTGDLLTIADGQLKLINQTSGTTGAVGGCSGVVLMLTPTEVGFYDNGGSLRWKLWNNRTEWVHQEYLVC